MEIGHHPGRDADIVESVDVVSDGPGFATLVSTGSGQEIVGRDRFDGT